MVMRRDVAVGLFADAEQARDAIGALKQAGFAGNDISLLMPDRGQAREMAAETGTHAGEGAATGAVAGGILGGLGGWLVGIGALAIPGVGPFIAAGAFATALGGAAVGAGVGAVAGALVGMGIPEDEARYYEQEVRGGRTLLAVQAGTRVDEADELLHRYGASDVQHRDRTAMAEGATGTTAVTDTRPLERGTYDRTEVTTGGSSTTVVSTSQPQPATRVATSRPGRTWDDEAAGYRRRWQERAGTSGGQWEDYEPRYRYGWEARTDPRYADRTWADAEPELQRDWQGRYPDRPWSAARESIREAWEGADRPTSSSA
jgi:hypothetical protein